MARRVNGRFADRPEFEANIRVTLSLGLIRMGDSVGAAEQARLAADDDFAFERLTNPWVE